MVTSCTITSAHRLLWNLYSRSQLPWSKHIHVSEIHVNYYHPSLSLIFTLVIRCQSLLLHVSSLDLRTLCEKPFFSDNFSDKFLTAKTWPLFFFSFLKSHCSSQTYTLTQPVKFSAYIFQEIHIKLLLLVSQTYFEVLFHMYSVNNTTLWSLWVRFAFKLTCFFHTSYSTLRILPTSGTPLQLRQVLLLVHSGFQLLKTFLKFLHMQHYNPQRIKQKRLGT